MNVENLLTLSYKSLKRSRTTIEDFVLSYYPYYGLQITLEFLKHFDIFVWVEAYIYRIDEENEDVARKGEICFDHIEKGLKDIKEFLRTKTLLSPALEEELNKGQQYWISELTVCRKLLVSTKRCVKLISPSTLHRNNASLIVDQIGNDKKSEDGKNIAASEMKELGGESEKCNLTLDEILSAHLNKSFDYRVLHHLLIELYNLPKDDRLFKFLYIDEQLVDIGDDLVDYEDDVYRNSFNLFRGFVALWGREAEEKLMIRILDLEKLHDGLLRQLPVSMRAHYWSRHKEASHEKGSEKWVFPPLIMDEESYRCRVRNSCHVRQGQVIGEKQRKEEVEEVEDEEKMEEEDGKKRVKRKKEKETVNVTFYEKNG